MAQNVTGIISDLKGAANTFRSGHGGGAYEAIGMISGVLKGTDAIMAAAGGPRVSGSITIGGEGKSSSIYETSALAIGTALGAGGNLTLNAGNDIHLIGAQAHAGNDLTLFAGNDVIIESSQSYATSGSKEQSWSAGIGIGGSAGVNGWSGGLQINGSYGQSQNEAWAIQQNNSHLSAGRQVSIVSGNDITVAGATIYGEDVEIDAGRDLLIQSRQDLAHSDGSSFHVGGSLNVGAGFSVSGSVGVGNSKSDVAWVTNQTGIYSGGNLDITVKNHTQINGAVIASQTGDLTLDTGTLGFETIKDHDRGSAFDVTIGGGYSNQGENKYPWDKGGSDSNQGGAASNDQKNDSKGSSDSNNAKSDPNSGKPPGVSVGGSIEAHDREQDTNATVGGGTIIIRDPENQKQDVADLNRDLDKAQVITKDESYGADFYASSSSLAEAAKGFKDIPQSLVDTVTNAAKGISVAGKGVEFIAQEITQKMVENGSATPEQKAQMDELITEFKKNPQKLKEVQEEYKNSGCGNQKSGFNLMDLFSTRANAAVPIVYGCYVVGGAIIAYMLGASIRDQALNSEKWREEGGAPPSGHNSYDDDTPKTPGEPPRTPLPPCPVISMCQWDTSATNKSSVTNVTTDVSVDQFVESLYGNGFSIQSQGTSKNGAYTVYTDGRSNYTIYRRTTTQEIGAEYRGPNGARVKITINGK